MSTYCPECQGSQRPRGGYHHTRSCSRAHRLVQPKLDSLTGTTRSVESMRGQVERESALRRAIAGACPRIPYGLISSVVQQCVTLDLELEAKGESR